MKEPDPEKFAQGVNEGKSLQTAMLEAGYSPSVARKGMAGVSGRMLKLITKDVRKMLVISRQFTLQEKGEIAMARLFMNCVAGRDGGIASAKTLGSHKDLALWQPDSQVGVVVLNAPNQLIQKKAELVEAEEVKE